MACPDHPWTKATRDSAAVRIAMTVAEAGTREGTLVEVEAEAGLDTDTPAITVGYTLAPIHADLSVGGNPGAARPLLANAGLASRGVQLMGAGFITDATEATTLGLGRRPGLERHIRPYRNGRDLLQRSRDALVIDLFGLEERDVRQRFPEVYDHLEKTVFVERKKPKVVSYLKRWWEFGVPRQGLRAMSAGLLRRIGTVETAKHRVFEFIDATVVLDNKVVVLALEDSFILGVLSSIFHRSWASRFGGLLEDRPVYVKTAVFDPFPFPDPIPEQRAAIADLGEELDATRKAALAEHPRLTMTGLYNLVERLRAGAALTPAEEVDARDARARIVRKLHDDLDAAVTAAYGWPADLAPAEIVARLVALNAGRAAEEKAGHVRWLRPDYQRPRFGKPPIG